MPDTNPSDVVPVQLAFIRGAMADLKQLSEANGQELDSLSQKVDRMESDQAHYYRKVDEIHKEIVGNHSPGLRNTAAEHETRITVLEKVKVPEAELMETRLANVSEVSELKVEHVKEGSIDWKFLAILAVNALVVIILAATNLK
jgi:uncharacterized coiled-coil DUF342 family protein